MAVLEEPIKGVKEVKNYINGEWVDSKGQIVGCGSILLPEGHREMPYFDPGGDR